jgi:hypothetical protein
MERRQREQEALEACTFAPSVTHALPHPHTARPSTPGKPASRPSTAGKASFHPFRNPGFKDIGSSGETAPYLHELGGQGIGIGRSSAHCPVTGLYQRIHGRRFMLMAHCCRE